MVLWVTKVFFTCVRLQTQPKISQKKNLERKNQTFGLWKNTYHTIFIYGKMLIIQFSYSFLYVWTCMKLYYKKFLIYGNCMIRSFDQPGITKLCTSSNALVVEKMQPTKSNSIPNNGKLTHYNFDTVFFRQSDKSPHCFSRSPAHNKTYRISGPTIEFSSRALWPLKKVN